VDISKDPIEQAIDSMHRQKVTEYYKDKNGREKTRVKEFLTYGVRLTG
jgi:sRNA-binding regulator protein Hfq